MNRNHLLCLSLVLGLCACDPSAQESTNGIPAANEVVVNESDAPKVRDFEEVTVEGDAMNKVRFAPESLPNAKYVSVLRDCDGWGENPLVHFKAGAVLEIIPNRSMGAETNFTGWNEKGEAFYAVKLAGDSDGQAMYIYASCVEGVKTIS